MSWRTGGAVPEVYPAVVLATEGVSSEVDLVAATRAVITSEGAIAIFF